MKKIIALIAILGITTAHAVAATATFDSQSTGTNHYYRPTTDGSYDWTDTGMSFNMNVTWGGAGWDGFTYSDVNDTTTAGSDNQYAVYGDGLDRSDTGVYGIGYYSSWVPTPPTVSFGSAMTVNGFYANNTTYAAISMLNGDRFAKKFGGTSGDDADWFKMTIEGFDSGSTTQGTVDFYLADYRFADNGQDYIINDWTFVDLSGLGSSVSSVQFSLSSSDPDDFGGMNTPSYFAMDELQAVPEPASALLAILGGLSIFVIRRAKIRQQSELDEV